MKKLIYLILVLGVLANVCFAAETAAKGRITEVTVYRGQALITRQVPIELAAGNHEIVVSSLPHKIISDSLYAHAADDISVLSVRYRERAEKEDTRAEVKELDRQIAEIKKSLRHTERRKGHWDNQWSMFIKLREFTVAAQNSDLNRGLLAFEPLKNLVELIQVKGEEYIEKALQYEDEFKELKKQLELLQRKRKNLAGGRSKTRREAIVYISKANSKKSVIKLSYLVNNASWKPQYNFRADVKKSNALIEYNGIVHQHSGESWKDVKLYLSTAEPTMVAAAPVLDPMKIRLGRFQQTIERPGQPGAMGPMENTQQVFKDLRSQRRQRGKKGFSANLDLNTIAQQEQVLMLNVSSRELSELKSEAQQLARIEGVSVTYSLPGQLSLPSRSEQQLVSIAKITVDADFTLVATPVLTDYVYLQGQLFNNSETILLPGQASMFRNGEFVGKGNTKLVTIGEKFTAGFGIDSQIQVTRELEKKKTRIQGGNRIDENIYRIAISNYKNTTVKLRLLDRLPYTDDSSVKIDLLKTTPKLSEDPEYVRQAKKKGILRWDIELKPNTIGQKATVVEYSFGMEYDKGMNILSAK